MFGAIGSAFKGLGGGVSNVGKSAAGGVSQPSRSQGLSTEPGWTTGYQPNWNTTATSYPGAGLGGNANMSQMPANGLWGQLMRVLLARRMHDWNTGTGILPQGGQDTAPGPR